MSDINMPFNEHNTAHVDVLVPLIRRAASQGMSAPWIVAPIEDLLHHANINAQDAQFKLTLMALRDQGIQFLVVPPKDAQLDNIVGDSMAVTDRIDADNDSIL